MGVIDKNEHRGLAKHIGIGDETFFKKMMHVIVYSSKIQVTPLVEGVSKISRLGTCMGHVIACTCKTQQKKKLLLP